MADSGWGAGAIGAFGAMAGSVVGAGIAGAALQSKKFRHVSSAHRERAYVLVTGLSGIVGALVGTKVALGKAIGCPACPPGQSPAVSTLGSAQVVAPTTSSWEGGATSAFGAMAGGVLAAGIAGAVFSSRRGGRVAGMSKQRAYILASSGGTVLGALFGGKAAADAGMGCPPCVPTNQRVPAPPPQVTPPTPTPPVQTTPPVQVPPPPQVIRPPTVPPQTVTETATI